MTSHLSAWLLAALSTLCGAEPVEPFPVTVSPQGRVRIEFLMHPYQGTSIPSYRVFYGKNEIVSVSSLGVDLEGEPNLGLRSVVEGVSSRSIEESYIQTPGKRREVKYSASETVIRLRQTEAPMRRWEVVLRASEDGAAVRYQYPAMKAGDSLAIEGELTEFGLPNTARVTALPVRDFTTSFEGFYRTVPIHELKPGDLLTLPVLAECENNIWAAITEANVNEYAGGYVRGDADRTLSWALSPLPKEPKIAVRVALPHASPWRVIMLGDRLGQLIEADLVLNLSEPCAIKDTSWIKSGKTTFPWWNGFYEKDVPFTPGLNTATTKHYIDFCASAGIPYHSLDGMDNTAWYGGPINPWEGDDPTTAVETIDIPEVLAYAKEKGVKLRLWMNWRAAEAHMDRSFPLYKEWGIEGVMLDFMDRDDQEMNRFLRSAVALAAENHLTVTLHGVSKPTGLERTYPNLLTSEGVLNLEYDKWDEQGLPPGHELTVAMTRMLAGPLDFHQGSFRTVRPVDFKARYQAPLVIGTPARTLASYVVYQNHLSMVADYPSAYRGHPGLPILAAIPTTWDDTRVLQAELSKVIVIARRSGANWYIGVMGDQQPSGIDLHLNLGFLGPGRFRAEQFLDDEQAPERYAIRDKEVTASRDLGLSLSPYGGGALIRLVPIE